MKTKKFKLTTSILLFFFIFANLATFAAKDEYSKKLYKEYDVNDESVLVISNKYGNVEMINWSKQKVSIDVRITVDHRDEEKAKELLEYLNVEFKEEGNKIYAETNIDNKFNKKGWFFNFGSDSKEFSIDYTVKMPKSINLELINKYGDVFIDEITGYAKVLVKYGNLKANKILRDNTKPLSQVELAYSEGSIEEVNWLKVKLKYSPKFQIERSKAVIAETKYSEIKIEENSSIVCESSYDQYDIGTISNLVCESKYTDINIKKLSKKLNITNKYGDIEVDEIPAGFEEIKVYNKYGQIDLKIAKNASYQIKGEAEYAKIDIPGKGKVNRIEENTELSIEGYVGTNANSNSKVNIDTKYGNVDLD